jgi:hypothetical protein
MATKRRRTTKPTKGGSSGFGNPHHSGARDPNPERTREEQHDDAMRVLRGEYYHGVLHAAREVDRLVKNEGMEEGDALHQVVDGSYWVIYTHANFQVLMCSDHHDAYMEDFGDVPTEGRDGLNWAALAYAAMARDVSERLGAGDLEPEYRDAPRAPRRSPGPRRASEAPRERSAHHPVRRRGR